MVKSDSILPLGFPQNRIMNKSAKTESRRFCKSLEEEHMGKISDLAWIVFEKTGGVKEYVKYKSLQSGVQNMEAGEELGAFEDRRDCNKNNKI